MGWLSQRRIRQEDTGEKVGNPWGGKLGTPLARERAHLERAVANRVEAVLGEGLEDSVDG